MPTPIRLLIVALAAFGLPACEEAEPINARPSAEPPEGQATDPPERPERPAPLPDDPMPEADPDIGPPPPDGALDEAADLAPDATPTNVCEQHPSRAAALSNDGPGGLYKLVDGSNRICRACGDPCRTPQPDPLPPGGPVAPDCDPCGLNCPLPACWTLAPPGA